MIDDIDKKILEILQTNPRIANADIARQVGLVPSAIFGRIKRLEEHGIIESYETRVNAKAFELGLLAFIFVRTDEGIGTVRTAELIAEIPEVQEVHHITGEDCYLVKVRTANTETLGQLLLDHIGTIKTVRSTRTTVVMGTSKETSYIPLAPRSPTNQVKKRKKRTAAIKANRKKQR